MPLDEFNDHSASQQRERAPGIGLRSQAVSGLRAFVDDVAYFWWAFAVLGAMILVAIVG